jgi:hypothetical protein
MTQLQRLVLDYRNDEEIVVRCLCRSEDAPNPGTVRRGRQVEDLVREGLSTALEALEGRVDVVGTSGFVTKEDVMLATTSPDAGKLAKGA